MVAVVVDAITLVQTAAVVDQVAVLLVTMDPQSSLVVLEHQVKETLVVILVLQITLVEAAAVALVVLVVVDLVIMEELVVLDQLLR